MMIKPNKEKGRGYVQEPGYSRAADGKIYIGIVKNNKDAMRMGRLEVWIPEMGGAPTDSGTWHIVSYASPFAGSTPVVDNIENSQVEGGSQKSYGWWAVPPDLDNQVLCCFVNGEATKGYWFACLWQQNMNHMVPGVASNISYQAGQQGILPPVVEYNKDQSSVNNFDPQNPKRPRFDVLHEAFIQQGLYTDFQRGPASTSARRESPSKAFGLLTPRANQLYIDDAPENEFIRLRTRSGVQVLIHDTGGFVYINSGTGNSWLEVSDIGIDAYTTGNFSVRADGDINLSAGRDINMQAGRHINGIAAENINLTAGLDLNALAGQELRLTAGTNLHFSAATNLSMGAGGKIGMASAVNDLTAASINRDGCIKDNCGGSNVPEATVARRAKSPPRIPAHEPWPEHPKARGTPASGATATSNSTTSATQTPKPSNKTQNNNPTVQQQTGDGKKKAVPYDANNPSSTKPTTPVPATPSGKGFKGFGGEVDGYIAKAASKYGIDEKVLRGFVKMEGGWTGAMSPTGAIGTGQFIQPTWDGLAKTTAGKEIGMRKIGSDFRKDTDPRYDKEVNTLATGLLAKENSTQLARAGLPATGENLYMMHNIGPGVIPALKGQPVSAETALAMRQNGMKPGMSSGEFVAMQKDKFNTHYNQANT